MSATISIRHAHADETPVVRRLSYLDDQRPLRGDVLLAIVDDEPLAALSLQDGRVVADPFARTADLVALLRLRAERLVAASRRRRGGGSLGGLRVRPVAG
jgi:hypothetical protein